MLENLSYYLKAKNKKDEPSTRYQPHELLLLYRERSGLSKLELARLLGFTSERMLQKWEGGYSLPIAARLKDLVSLYLERKVFLPGREIEEAHLLWQVIKDYHDATSPGFEVYPVTDMLLQQMEPTQYQTFLEKGKTFTTTKAIEKAFSLPFISGKVN